MANVGTITEENREEAERIGQIIAREREKKNLTRSDLGRLLGVSWPTIRAWEEGHHLPPIFPFGAAMANMFGCSLDYLCGLSPYRNDSSNPNKNIVLRIKVGNQGDGFEVTPETVDGN